MRCAAFQRCIDFTLIGAKRSTDDQDCVRKRAGKCLSVKGQDGISISLAVETICSAAGAQTLGNLGDTLQNRRKSGLNLAGRGNSVQPKGVGGNTSLALRFRSNGRERHVLARILTFFASLDALRRVMRAGLAG